MVSIYLVLNNDPISLRIANFDIKTNRRNRHSATQAKYSRALHLLRKKKPAARADPSSHTEAEPSAFFLESLSTRVFETQTATGSELFSLLTCPHTTTFTLLSIFSPLDMISIKIWETPLSWLPECSLPSSLNFLSLFLIST